MAAPLVANPWTGEKFHRVNFRMCAEILLALAEQALQFAEAAHALSSDEAPSKQQVQRWAFATQATVLSDGVINGARTTIRTYAARVQIKEVDNEHNGDSAVLEADLQQVRVAEQAAEMARKALTMANESMDDFVFPQLAPQVAQFIRASTQPLMV